MQVISEKLIFVNENLATQEDLFRFIGEKMIKEGRAENIDKIIEGLYERENEFSTCFGFNAAIPHCRNEYIKYSTVVIVKTKNNITWTDGEQCNLFFSIMIPIENAGKDHIRILAKIAEKMMDDAFMEKMNNATSVCDIYSDVELLNGG